MCLFINIYEREAVKYDIFYDTCLIESDHELKVAESVYKSRKQEQLQSPAKANLARRTGVACSASH